MAAVAHLAPVSWWKDWGADPPFTFIGIAAVLWWQGGRHLPAAGGPTDRVARRRSACFWSGLGVLVLSLNSPFDIEASRLLWVHMIQHVVLLTVAPPLLVLSRPLPRLLRGVPRGTRLALVRGWRRARWNAPLRALGRPWPAWWTFVVMMLGWHLPALYDLTLRVDLVHDLEHLCFIVAGLLFWSHALAAPPFGRGLDWPGRVLYLGGAMVASWLLAIVLELAQHPLYAHYAQLGSRPGGISALTDQRLAAGVMWVPGSFAFTIAIAWAVWRWLEPARPASTGRLA